jgi:3-hydroxyacyl-CoA dehydrogenase
LVVSQINLTFQVLKELVAAGMCGRKSDKGMYVYAKGQKDRPVNQEALDIIKKYATEAPAATSGDEDLQLRLVSRYENSHIRFAREFARICTRMELPRSQHACVHWAVVEGSSNRRFYY